MAAHSSVLAWRIPGMGEPGGLPSMGSHLSDTIEATQQQKEHHILFFPSLFMTAERRVTPGESSLTCALHLA